MLLLEKYVPKNDRVLYIIFQYIALTFLKLYIVKNKQRPATDNTFGKIQGGKITIKETKKSMMKALIFKSY